jgi:segregation and condensation protein A
MKYEIKIDEFEGPLDLLLHLIKTSDVDIFDIEIDQITKQYLSYIEQMEELNLNIASEYLVMAAELMEIKSAILLPKPEVVEDEYEEDPREQLIQRLLEYKQYKEVSSKFQELEEERKQIYTKIPENLKNYGIEEAIPVLDIDLEALMDAFQKFLQRKEEEKPLHTTVTTKEYSVKERSREIRSILRTKKQVKFEELFEINRRDYIIVTFLSILTMCKKQELSIQQDSNFNEIYLSLKGGNV